MKNYLLLLLNLLSFCTSAQIEIPLKNPSFEEDGKAFWGYIYPRTNGSIYPRTTIKSWTACGPRIQTPPDIHSADTLFWSAKQVPHDGNYFLGMVTRSNGTKEGISQELTEYLQKGSMYKFSFFASQSKTYVSNMTVNSFNYSDLNFTELVHIEVWGGTCPCEKKRTLGYHICD